MSIAQCILKDNPLVILEEATVIILARSLLWPSVANFAAVFKRNKYFLIILLFNYNKKGANVKNSH